jgi:hypothetical protein
MLRFIAIGAISPLPGIEALQPGSASCGQSAPLQEGAQQWFTVGAEFSATDGHPIASLGEFSSTTNDLLLASDSCHDVGVEVADSLRVSGTDVHHHNYFANQDVRQRLARWLSL